MLYEDADYTVTIVSAAEVVPYSAHVLAWYPEEHIDDLMSDQSWSWHVIAGDHNGDYLTIDFEPDRAGRCYDSYWELHPDDSPIIGLSFTDLIQRLLDNCGRYWYWLEDDFGALGAAYQT